MEGDLRREGQRFQKGDGQMGGGGGGWREWR